LIFKHDVLGGSGAHDQEKTSQEAEHAQARETWVRVMLEHEAARTVLSMECWNDQTW